MSAHVYLGVAANAIAVLAVGYAVLYGLGLARGTRAALRFLGLAYLVGTGVLGTALTYLLVGGVRFDLELVLTVAALLVVIGAVVGRVTPRVPSLTAPSSSNPLARAATVIGATVILLASLAALVVAVQANWTPDSDTIALWVPHAQTIYYEHGLRLGPAGWTAMYHPEYPPLISVIYAGSFVFVGGFHPSLLSFDQCLLGLSFIGAVLALIDRCAARWIAFPSIALLVVAPEFFTRLDSLLPDQTLAYFVAAAALTCVMWLRERRTAWLALTVILSAAGTLTKSEGVTYAVLLFLIVVCGAAWRRQFKLALAAFVLLLGAAAIEPWRRWLGDHGFAASSTDYKLSSVLHPLYLAHRIGRINYALHEVLHVTFRPGNWLVVLPLALFSVVAVARASPLFTAAATAWLLLAFAGLIFVYWAGQFAPFTLVDEVQTSATRVSATIVIVAGAMVPLILGVSLGQRKPVGDAVLEDALPGPGS